MTHRRTARLASTTASVPGTRVTTRALAAFAWLVVACDAAETSSPHVAPSSGLEQSSASTVSAVEGCDRYQTALEAKASELGCQAADVPAACSRVDAPLECVAFTTASVDQCVNQVAEYEACSEFTSRGCFLTLVGGAAPSTCAPAAADSSNPLDAALTPDAGAVPSVSASLDAPPMQSSAPVPPPDASVDGMDAQVPDTTDGGLAESDATLPGDADAPDPAQPDATATLADAADATPIAVGDGG